MGLENNVPRELKDNICESLGSRKARLLRLVQVEVKADRLDTRVLVLTDFRLLIFTTKVPAKCEHNVHLLDINTLDSKAPNRLLVGSAQKRISVHTLGDTGEVDSILLMLADALYMAFPALKLQELVPSFKVSDDARMLSVLDKVKDSKARHGEPGPCGGFSTAYRCMCDLLNQPVQEEVAWDVDTIYLSQDSHELALQDFDHLDSKLLVPIIAALKHNTWFTKLNATNVKLGMEASTEILTVVKHNKCLEELNLAGVGVKADFVQRLAVALNANSDCQLRALDLSANMVEDKGVMSLCTPLSKLPRGLTQLSLRQAGLSSKGINRLAEALTANKFASTSLTHLDLSNNVLKADDLSNLYQFLSQPNALTHLNLSGTECALDTLFGPLQRGCLQHLSQLHLAGTCFSYKKSRDMSVPQTWKNFFAMTLALSSVNLSDCKNLLPEAVKNLLLGLSSNPVLEAVSVNLSGCGLGAVGAQVLDNCLENLQHVTHLDLSDNSFDTDMKKIIEKMGKNRCIKSLNVGRNFAGIKPKYLGQVLERIVLLIQDENSPVESLSLADSKLRADTTIIINALGANASLREIDVSGNQMGDVGARMLAKALQLNTKLTTVCWDNNVTTAQGFSDIAAALDKNFTLKKMPTPINDAMLALKTQPEKTQAALQKIESLLQRNHSPRKFASDQMYRLQQGFLLSSTQQMVDKLSAQIESLLSSRPTIPAASAEAAKQLLQDAERSRRILPECQKMALQSEGDNREMDQRLRLVGQELQNLVENQVKKNMSSMLDCASSQCPTVMGNTAFAEEVRLACSEHGTVPQNFTEALMVEQVGTDVTNKISEVNLSVAAHLSDKLIDGVLDSLEKTHRKLLSESRGVSGESQLDRDARVSIIRQKSTSSTTSTDTLGESPKLATKKKSLHDRRLRPQSNINPKEVHEAAQRLKLQEITVETVPESPPALPKTAKPTLFTSSSSPKFIRRAAPSTPPLGERDSSPRASSPRVGRPGGAPPTPPSSAYREGGVSTPPTPPAAYRDIKRSSVSSLTESSSTSSSTHHRASGIPLSRPANAPPTPPSNRASMEQKSSSQDGTKPDVPPLPLGVTKVERDFPHPGKDIAALRGHAPGEQRAPRPVSQPPKFTPPSSKRQAPQAPTSLDNNTGGGSMSTSMTALPSSLPSPRDPSGPSPTGPIPAPRRKKGGSTLSLISTGSNSMTASITSLDQEQDNRSQTEERPGSKAASSNKGEEDEEQEATEELEQGAVGGSHSHPATAFDMAEAEIKEIRLDEDRQSVDSLDATDLMVDTDGTGDSLLDSRESTPSSDMSRSRMNRSQEMIAEFDDISPLESGNRLNHLSKNRPKRAKTRAASRAVIQSEAQTIEDIGGMDVDDFFKPSAATNTGSEENQNAINRSVSQESSKTDDTSDKKKGFKAPFGVETKNIAAGISNFFSRKSPKSPEPKPLEVSPSESSHADKRHSPGREMEEKKDEEKEDRSPTGGPKLPPGARAGLPGMAGGLGGGFLSELKNKQRPKSTLIENEAKKDADSVKVSLAPSQPRALVPRSQRESQAPRNTSPGADDKPRPPVKPRPPGVKPKPGPAPAAPTPSARSTMFGGSTSPPKTVSSMRPMSTALPKTPVGGVTTPAANRPTSVASPPTRSFSVRAYLRRFQDPDDDQPDGGSASNKDPSSSPRSSAIKKRGSVRERAQLIDQNSNMDKPSAASTGSTPDSSSILRTKTLNPTASASERSETRSRLVRSLISETTASSRASSGEPPPLPTTLPPGDDDDDSDSCSDEDGGGKPNGRNTDIIYI